MSIYLERIRREEQQCINKLTNEFPLRDVTTDRQLKNNTRMFEISDGEFSGHRFATYDSGMVRKIIRTRFNELSCYQLNPTRTSIRYWMGSNMEIQSHDYSQRVPIYNGVNRLLYLKKYLIKNYNMKPVQDIIEVNGFKYKRI
jgi:hypothetical protein